MVIRIMLVENFPRSLRSLSIYCTITELNVVVFFLFLIKVNHIFSKVLTLYFL